MTRQSRSKSRIGRLTLQKGHDHLCRARIHNLPTHNFSRVHISLSMPRTQVLLVCRFRHNIRTSSEKHAFLTQVHWLEDMCGSDSCTDGLIDLRPHVISLANSCRNEHRVHSTYQPVASASRLVALRLIDSRYNMETDASQTSKRAVDGWIASLLDSISELLLRNMVLIP